MKITSFNPVVITKDLESVVSVFEDLGFEKEHNPAGESGAGNQYEACRLQNADGFHVDVATTSAPMERDLSAIRVNVADFDEACEFLSSRGFKISPVTNTGSAKACIFTAPSGFAIDLIQHLRNHD